MRAVWTTDNGIAVFTPAKGVDLAEAARKLSPTGAFEIVSEIPGDRTFRNAWTNTGGKVAVDMPKAREIHMDRIRKVRDAKLQRLDIDQLRGNDVAAEKQRLRNIPQTFDLTVATTPEELKALWPEGL